MLSHCPSVNNFLLSQKHYKKDGYRQLNVRQLGSLRPWDHHGKCYMDRKRIQCLSNALQHVSIYLQPFLKYSSGGSRGGGAAPIDETNFCINVKSHLRMNQNPPFSGENSFFSGEGQPPPKTPPLTVHPHYKVLDPPLRYSGISVASDWFSTVLVSE